MMCQHFSLKYDLLNENDSVLILFFFFCQVGHLFEYFRFKALLKIFFPKLKPLSTYHKLQFINFKNQPSTSLDARRLLLGEPARRRRGPPPHLQIVCHFDEVN